MSAAGRVTRRALLAAAGAGFVCSCASMPKAGGGAPGVERNRTCDHDLCRYWRRNDAATPHLEDLPGDPESGWCSIALPEVFK